MPGKQSMFSSFELSGKDSMVTPEYVAKNQWYCVRTIQLRIYGNECTICTIHRINAIECRLSAKESMVMSVDYPAMNQS